MLVCLTVRYILIPVHLWTSLEFVIVKREEDRSHQSQPPNKAMKDRLERVHLRTVMDWILLKSRHVRCLPDITKKQVEFRGKINRINT